MTADRRCPHGRGGALAVWLSALLLLALVAAAGLPVASAAPSPPPRVERVEGGRAAILLVTAEAAASGRERAQRAAVGSARPRPRTRDGQRRGLPPCRAPTC
ncbi:MAG: hypothetical protein FJ301_12170 [Planctomycetes bacterium]|nr:hypothetical protein [Planctomycetota bacterium]